MIIAAMPFCFNKNMFLADTFTCPISGKIFVSLSDFGFEISILSLSPLIGLPLDIVSKCKNILSKPNDTKVSSVGAAGTPVLDFWCRLLSVSILPYSLFPR